jgi:capsular polysaccharide transport system permease protein
MTVLESVGLGEGGAKEPIKFPGTKEERREERLRRRGERSRRTPETESAESPTPLDYDYVLPPEPQETAEPAARPRAQRSRLQVSWIFLSFLIMVAVPGAIGGFYFAFIASPQYVVETQFSVRGSNQSSMASFGLSGLFGSSVQSGDSYIVSSYIQSVQLIRDVKEQLGIDLRQYFSKNDVDFYYRIDPNMPLEKFSDYWSKMTEVSFNSTTGNTTLFIYGFSADDSKAIADAVLKVSERLVNDLSEKNRQQMTVMATSQVGRSEQRLRAVRDQIRKLRSEVQVIDPTELVKGDAAQAQRIENELLQFKNRQAVLVAGGVGSESPTARLLQKQIKVSQDQLNVIKNKIGDLTPGVATKTSRKVGDDTNVASIVDKFEGLTIEQEFATKAYTTSLAALEASLSEAQKQERYFATFVAPARPDIALYPQRLLDTFILVLVLGAFWLISQFLYRSFRDHAI